MKRPEDVTCADVTKMTPEQRRKYLQATEVQQTAMSQAFEKAREKKRKRGA